MKYGISLNKGIFWVLVWFGFMLLYTTLNVVIWRKLPPMYGKYLNLLSIILCMIIFLVLLMRENNFKINLLENISFLKITLAIGCSIFLFFLLDKGIDPILERMFPASEGSYQETLQSLRFTPFISLLQVCILAPFIEEIIMRGFLLDALSINYGKIIALLVSALLFALLHFNMVQTLSAFISGIVLGVLYLYTGSLSCCIVTHMGYNLISYVVMLLPLYSK